VTTALESYLSYVVLDKRIAPSKRAPRRYAKSGSVLRDERYKAWIRTLDCVGCGGGPAEAAHTGTDGGRGLKASDWSCVPLCRKCHRVLYHGLNGGKRSFERAHMIDFAAIVERLRAEYATLGRKVAI